MGNGRNKTQHIRQGIISRGENDTGICVYDKEDPRSVYSICPPALQASIERVNPEFFKYTEKALLKALERLDLMDDRVMRLRLSFWCEYNRVQDGFLDEMNIRNIITGICDSRFFYEDVMTNPRRMAWILFPVTAYRNYMEEMLEYSLRELREVLKFPLTKTKTITKHHRNGDKTVTEFSEPDYQVIREKIKIFALMDNRLKGAVTQTVKVESETRNYHAHANIQDLTKNVEATKSLSRIEDEIRKLAPVAFKNVYIDTVLVEDNPADQKDESNEIPVNDTDAEPTENVEAED